MFEHVNRNRLNQKISFYSKIIPQSFLQEAENADMCVPKYFPRCNNTFVTFWHNVRVEFTKKTGP